MKRILLFVLVLVSLCAEAQNLKKLYSEAEQAVIHSDYSLAIECYNDILKIEENIPHVLLELGIAYFHNLQYLDAEQIFTELIAKHHTIYPEAYFYLAEIQTLFGNYKAARRNYSMFSVSHSKNTYMNNKTKHELLSKKSKTHSNSQNHLQYVDSPYLMQSYGIYSYKNTLLYNGIYSIGDSLKGRANFYTYDTVNKTMKEFFPYTTYHISDFCDIGDTILVNIQCRDSSCTQSSVYYICVDSLTSGTFKPYVSDVFPSEYKNIHFQKIKIDSSEYILFSSNRPGGYGGMDIWISERVNNSFMPAKNAGAHINTQGDEICPFYENTQSRLYFSSNWHDSFGGFDVFYAQRTENQWEEVKNMGEHINSSYNEYYYKIIDTVAYVVSNRKSKSYENTTYYYNTIYWYPYIIPKKSQITDSLESIAQKTSIIQDTTYTFYVFFDDNSPQIITEESSITSLFNDYMLTQNSLISAQCSQLNFIEKQVCTNKIHEFFRYAESQFNDFIELCEVVSQYHNISSFTISLQASTSSTGSIEANQIIAENRLFVVSQYFDTKFANCLGIAPEHIVIKKLPHLLSYSSKDNIALQAKQNAEQRYVKIEVHVSKTL